MTIVRIGAMLLAVLCAACSSTSNAESTSAAPPAAAKRIVALMPSLVEDLYAMGAASQVVAVSSFTDIKQFKSLPRVADFNSVDTERIVSLHPDAVIGIPAQARLVEPLKRAGIPVTLLRDDTYDDIFANIRAVGTIAGRDREANELVARLKLETAQLNAHARRFTYHPSVFVVLGSGPIWTAGSSSYISSLIALAGGTNAAGDLHAAYGQYSGEALLRVQPDAIVTDPAIHLDAVLDREPWRSLRAVKEGNVFSVNPASMIERPGPYYNEGLRWLVERLTPLGQRR